MKLCGKKWIQKICKICDVLQIYVYLFINKSYCQQVYSSHYLTTFFPFTMYIPLDGFCTR